MGAGSLQEMDHVPVVQSITKSAGTVFDTAQCAVAVNEALHQARSPHRGPVFLDFPMDVLFHTVEGKFPTARRQVKIEPDGEALTKAIDLLEAHGVP